ncbi:MAG: GH39 family glycosyl hydrolase [Anaerolineae bacterium]|jgi:xylan 1,4-beta-xylosidase|nr:hypothetical protein [Chloroflexota bacterium]
MSTSAPQEVTVRVDASQWRGMLPHAWTYIGYDECNYTTSPEGEALLNRIGAFQEQPYYVRCHHLFCTGNRHGFYKWGSTNVYLEDPEGEPIYDWTEIDLILDTIRAAGLKPFVELGFMPRDLADPRFYDAAGDGGRLEQYQRSGWASPPRVYSRWYDLVRALVEHLVERHGAAEVASWYFELWNEPDIRYYWKGTLQEYCTLYDYTAAAVKDALPEGRVGGPGTTHPMPGNNAAQWLDGFCAHCTSGTNAVSGEVGTPLDFVSFHLKGGGYRADPLNRPQAPPSVRRMLQGLLTGYEILSRYPGLTALECVISECDPDGWAAGGAWDNACLNFRNTEYYASFVAAAFTRLLHLAAQRAWDVKLLTWAFVFVGERCFEGTRALSTQGIDKAILNLLRMGALLGHRQLALESSGERDPLAEEGLWDGGDGPDVWGLAAQSGDGALQVLLYSHHDDWERPERSTVTLELEGLPPEAAAARVEHYRIDGQHSNAWAEWLRQGRPRYPAGGQREAILSRAGLELLEPPRELPLEEGALALKLEMPAHSVSLLRIVPQRAPAEG